MFSANHRLWINAGTMFLPRCFGTVHFCICACLSYLSLSLPSFPHGTVLAYVKHESTRVQASSPSSRERLTGRSCQIEKEYHERCFRLTKAGASQVVFIASKNTAGGQVVGRFFPSMGPIENDNPATGTKPNGPSVSPTLPVFRVLAFPGSLNPSFSFPNTLGTYFTP